MSLVKCNECKMNLIKKVCCCWRIGLHSHWLHHNYGGGKNHHHIKQNISNKIIIMVGKKSSEYEAKSSSWWEKLTYHIKLKIIQVKEGLDVGDESSCYYKVL